MDRGEKNKRPRNLFEANCLNFGKKGHRDEAGRSMKKKIEKTGHAAADKKLLGQSCHMLSMSDIEIDGNS